MAALEEDVAEEEEADAIEEDAIDFLCGGGAVDDEPVIDESRACNACMSSFLVGNLLIVHGTRNTVNSNAGRFLSARPLLDVFARMSSARSTACSWLSMSPNRNASNAQSSAIVRARCNIVAPLALFLPFMAFMPRFIAFMAFTGLLHCSMVTDHVDMALVRDRH